MLSPMYQRGTILFIYLLVLQANIILRITVKQLIGGSGVLLIWICVRSHDVSVGQLI